MECTLILCQVKTPKKHNKILIESHWTSIGSETLMEFRKHTAQKYPPFKEKHLTNFNKIKTFYLIFFKHVAKTFPIMQEIRYDLRPARLPA